MNYRNHQELFGLLDEEAYREPYTEPSPPASGEETRPTPFPYKTIGILVLSNAIAEAAFHVVYPFMNQMIAGRGIAKRPDYVGYYSGLLQSGAALSGFLTTIPCSYASDIYGRKPVLIASMVGIMISMFLFGTARSFAGLFTSRCIGGGIGPSWTWTASYTILGEITDSSNAAPAYSAVKLGYSVGSMISPSIGGFLAHPSDRFSAFQTEFWKNNPYALPCFTGVLIAGIALIIVVIGLSETLPSKRYWARKHNSQTSVFRRAKDPTTRAADPEGFRSSSIGVIPLTGSIDTLEATENLVYGLTPGTGLPATNSITVRDVLTPITIPVMANSFSLSFLTAAWSSIYPLWAFMPIDKGGLGAAESSIGLHLSTLASLEILVIMLYGPLRKRLGLYKLYTLSMAMWIPAGLCYPLFSLWAKASNSSESLIFQTSMLAWFAIRSWAGIVWTANLQMVTRVSPSEEALARTISVSTICTLLGGTLGPVLATSLFQWSISHDFLGGNLIWVLMFITSTVSAFYASTLQETDSSSHIPNDEPAISPAGSQGSWAE